MLCWETYQKSPRTDKGRPRQAVLAVLVATGKSQGAAQGEADGPEEVPKANVPAQRCERGSVPVWLRL